MVGIMVVICPLTIASEDSCVDTIDCTQYVAQCSIPTYKSFVYVYCRKTCDLCQECIDTDDRCQYWVKNQFCKNGFYEKIRYTCAKSCDFCWLP